MASRGFRFERFLLDPDDRRLSRDGVALELNARYFDALLLLLREAGRLVPKEQFLDEVWRGVPVTDEALTQCIRTLRRQLDDDAARPRFIETVPKHGYRFIAPVERAEEQVAADPAPPPVSAHGIAAPFSLREVLLLGGAGVMGAGAAGVMGGLFYGIVGGLQTPGSGVGAASVLLVLLCLSLFASVIGGLGVAVGIAVSAFGRTGFSWWSIVGGAVGGLIVGGLAKLLGLDAFNLLFGQAPGDITGAAEGSMLGAAVGLGAWLGTRDMHVRGLAHGIAIAASLGAAAGFATTFLGGRLLGGSLELLARSFPHSRLRLDPVGALFGEQGFGPTSAWLTGAGEGAIFAGCIVGGLALALRALNGTVEPAGGRVARAVPVAPGPAGGPVDLVQAP
jgi:DNA-binding winged helix-turn-helix (wHTH) protein